MGLVLRIELDGEKYELDPDTLTLDEACLLSEDYGMEDFLQFSPFNPKQMKGMLVVAVQRAHPEKSSEEVRVAVGAIQTGPIMEDVDKQLQKAIADVERKQAGKAAGRVRSGHPAKSRAGAGTRGTRKSSVSKNGTSAG